MPHFTPENFQTCIIGMLLGRAAMVKDRILDSHLQDFGVTCLLYTSPSPRDGLLSRMPSSA